MKLNLHPKGIPKQEPLGADTPLKKGGVVVGMRKEDSQCMKMTAAYSLPEMPTD